MFNWKLPEGAPRTTNDLYAYLSKVTAPTVDDLRLMLLIEVVGKKLYDNFADHSENPEVQELLRKNGREELGHAHRLSKVVQILSGEPFPVPELHENPIYQPVDPVPVTRDLLTEFAALEFGGGDLYGGWAAACGNDAAAALLRQNGQEETNHARRLQRAVELLAA